MKKTLTVNLGGSVFHIDEDAYQLLDRYLTNLGVKFKEEEGGEEIMNDFELRISELFAERLKAGIEVITLKHVEAVIQQMGKPEDLFDEDEASPQARTEEVRPTVQKRLFRDPDDTMLGGVASGIAAYLGCDPTVVRLVLLLLIFVFGLPVLAYLILWVVLPVARTATEKLQMRGESDTIENIGRTVTDSFERVSSNVNDFVHSERSRNLLHKTMGGFTEAISIFLKIVMILLAIALFPPLLFLFLLVFVALAAVLGGGVGLLANIFPAFHWELFAAVPESSLLVFIICTILTIAIPLLAVLHLLFGRILKFKPLAGGVKWALLIMWFVAFTLNVAVIAKHSSVWMCY